MAFPQPVFVRSMLLFIALLVAGSRIATAQAQKELQPSSDFYPLSIAAGKSGEAYLADRNLPGIWKLEGEKLTLFFRGSKKFRTPLNAVRCVEVDGDGNLLAGDSSTREVYRFNEQGVPIGLTRKPPTEAAKTPSESAPGSEAKHESGDAQPKDAEKSAGDTPAPDAEKPRTARPNVRFGQVGIPMDIAVASDGTIFVSDLEIHRIVKVPSAGGNVEEFAQVQAPRGLCFDRDQNLWVVSGRRLLKISPAGDKTTVVDDGVFEFPHTVAVADDNTAYVCDGYSKAIWKVPAGGKPEKLVSGQPLVNPVGMTLVGDKLLVVDPRAKAVFEITFDGKVTTIPLKPATE